MTVLDQRARAGASATAEAAAAAEPASLEQRLAAVLGAARGPGGAWLRKLLGTQEALRAFGALHGEIFMHGGEASRVIAIASAVRGEGRTSMAQLLAIFAAATEPGRSVLLVDADIDNPSIATTLDVAGGAPGLAELFAGAATPRQCVHATALPNLAVTPGGREGRGAPILSGPAFEGFLAFAREEFDLVVVDTPASGTSRAILPIAKIARDAVVEVRYGGPTREQVASLVAELKLAGVNVLGCVMNRREYVVPAFLYG
jgi:Mrp family chromosome partitioning ATPase